MAVEWGLLDRAPKLQMVRGEKRRDRVVAEDDFAAYLLHCSPLLADVASVLSDTGMRPDECHRLDWSDITFVNGRHGKLLIGSGKAPAARQNSR